MAHPRRAALAVAALAAVAGCGGGSGGGSGVNAPTIGAAKTYQLQGFEPTRPVSLDKPTKISFDIEQPSGKPLIAYKTGAGPHTGVHLIVVRDDLSRIIHMHPPIGADGKVDQSVAFPAPGPWKVLVDAYPKSSTTPNFQLFDKVDVAGAYKPQKLPSYKSTQTIDGYTFTIHNKPKLKAIDPAFLTVTITDPQGRPAKSTPWFGALAHAIFFRAGSLDYFHTHVCGANTPGCANTGVGAKIAGHSSTPGKLSVGILLPVAGTWRLFLQTKVQGHILTAPFTLRVK
jgi:hypothetical protein